MIADALQHWITQRAIGAFEASISALLDQGIDGEADDTMFRRLQVDAMRSQLADLQEDVAVYEAALTEARPLVGAAAYPNGSAATPSAPDPPPHASRLRPGSSS